MDHLVEQRLLQIASGSAGYVKGQNKQDRFNHGPQMLGPGKGQLITSAGPVLCCHSMPHICAFVLSPSHCGIRKTEPMQHQMRWQMLA